MYLRVGRAITPPSAQVFTMPLEAANLPTASALAAAAITAKICAMEANVSAATLLRPLSPGHPAAPGNPFGPGGSLLASIRAHGDSDLDEWAAERLTDVFQVVYGKALEVVRVRA